MPHNIDPENMFKAIWEFPENIQEALEIGAGITLDNQYENIDHILIAGMGGSAIGGDVVSVLENESLKVPFQVVRGYTCPSWVNENTLVICSSYSGNTEETLSALDHALEKKAQICGITTGGELAERLHSLHKDVVKIPAGLQPRAALAFSFVPMIKLLEKAGIISSSLDDWIQEAVHILKEARKTYSKDRDTNPVFHLAERVKERIPVIYADSSTLGVAAVRLKGQLAENSKILAWYNELPELNHNEIVGWENNADIFQRLFVLWLMDRDDHERVQHRQEITRTLLQEAGVDQIAISVPGNLFKERFLHMIHYGDWLSYWCAILHGTDPSPVVKIARLKQELADRK